jgi:CheY-like chemotaxis protein
MNDVLVIDDEPAIRNALTRVLERAGHKVRVAVNGADGLEILKAQAADVVITDIIMPKLHGVDAIKAIVEAFPQVRIVAISGGGNFSSADYQPYAIKTEAYLAAAKLAGAHAVLTKPFKTHEVLQAVEAALNAPPNTPQFRH